MPFHPQPLFFVAMGLVLGTLVPLPEVSASLVIAVGLAAALSASAILRPGRLSLTALIVASVAAGAALATEARAAYRDDSPDALIRGLSGPMIIEGLVISDPHLVEEELRFDVEAAFVIAGGQRREYRGRVRFFVRNLSDPSSSPPGRVIRGDRINAWVELRIPEPIRTPGGFDQLEWSMREGVHVFAACKSERLLRVIAKGNGEREWLDRIRDRLIRSWRHVDDQRDRAVTASMVLGDENALDATTRDEFRAAGLLHLLVVSGSQVAVLILGLRRVLPLPLRISWTGCAVEWALLLAYCRIAGAGDSMVRATVMAMTFAVAVRVDLHRGGANFLFASAIALLAMRPLDALDPGAQLSFTATLALVVYAGSAARKLQALRMPGFLADLLSATLVATIATAPLTLIHFHRLSLIALPANLLAAPLAVLLLYSSLMTAALDVLIPPLAPLGGWICGLTAESLRALAHHAAALDPDWRGPSPPLTLLLGAVGLVAASGWRRVALPAAGLLASLSLSDLPRGDGRLHVWFLDVGQGDSILIETPEGRVAAIDAGPAFENFDAGERVVSEALWELGHRRLAFMGITHRHSDHEGGAPFLARHFAPEAIYVNADSRTLKDWSPVTATRGDFWVVDGVLFRVLGPDPDWPLPRGDENARSLVIEMTYGATSFLFMGDASTLSEALLEAPSRRYDVVKVAHHGAATSSSESFVGGARPGIAVISVGARNRFSHPNAAVVERWSRGGAMVWRTDLQHTLHLVSDGRTVTR